MIAPLVRVAQCSTLEDYPEIKGEFPQAGIGPSRWDCASGWGAILNPILNRELIPGQFLGFSVHMIAYRRELILIPSAILLTFLRF